MKIRLLICALFIISFYNMKAQGNLSVNMNLKTESTDQINFNETNIGIKTTNQVNTKNKVTNTFEYSHLKANYELGSFTSLENLDNFNHLQSQFDFLHSISNATKLNFSLTPTANFQQNFGISDVTILGSFEIRKQLNSNTNLSIGVTRTSVFGHPEFMPLLSLNYKLNKTSLLIGFPDSKISYSNNIRNKFSLSNSFNGNFYNLDSKINIYENATKVSLSQMTSAFEYERNVDNNWFLNFKAGYDFNKKYTLTDNDNHTLYDFKSGNGYILGIGIKYKQ